MKLLVVVLLTLTLSHVVVSSVRVRRMMTDKEKSDILNHHNALRAQEGSSNMEYMTWNESLAVAAADWAAQCVWDHGFPPLPGTDFITYGQNLYMTTAAKIDVIKGIQVWYDEKQYYDYDTLGCAPDEICGHYTQVVWAMSRQVGCAYHFCRTVEHSAFRNAQYLACNYLPLGNFHFEKPFKKGPACSKCGSGAGWCKDKLCNSRCSEAGKDCTCEAVCHNCAELDLKACRCSCPDGWDEADCSDRCEDRSKHCNPIAGIPGWTPDWCDHDEHGSMVKRNCPLMCKLCKPDPDAEANKCPPVSAHDGHDTNDTVAADATKFVNSSKSPAGNVSDDNDDKNNHVDNCGQHQQQHSIVALLSYVILLLSLTITWKALL